MVDAQLCVFAGNKSWQGVHLRFSALRGPGKATIGAASLRWRRIASVRTEQPGYQTRYVGLWPDPLLPAAPFNVDAHGRAFVWVDMRVPTGAKAGNYRGTATLSGVGESTVTVPITLRVWGYAMPRQSHIRTAFGTGFNGSHPLDDNAVKDDLLAHRLTPTNCVGSPRIVAPSGPGQAPSYDWTDFDKSMTRRLAQGMTGFAVDFPNQTPDRVRAYQEHLSSKGWLRYAYVYAADEPENGQLGGLNGQLAAFKHAAPGIPLLVTARGYPDALTNVDIWCPAIVVERDDYFQPAQSVREQGRGRASWWYPSYVSHAPSINLWTDYPLLDDRIWPWLTWKHNLDGMLYWSTTNWRDVKGDPLSDARTFLDANGDGELIYPDAQGKPIDSLRLEALRDGMQDYEVFCLLEAGARELSVHHAAPVLVKQAQSLCAIDNALITDYKHFSSDPQVLLAARARMSVALEQIVTRLGHEPHIIDRPRYRPLVTPTPGL